MSSTQGRNRRRHHSSCRSSDLFSATGDGNAAVTIVFPTLFSSWTLPDAVNYIFHLVWVCGIPVHYRYVAHLLSHLTASKELMDREVLKGKVPVADHQFYRVVQRDVFPLVCCRAKNVNEYVVQHQLGDNDGAVARLVALSQVVSDADTYQIFTNSESEGATVEIIEVTTDGNADIDVLALCSPSLSMSGSSSDRAEWKAETYRTAMRYSRQLELYLTIKEDIVISPTESDDDTGKRLHNQAYFSVEMAHAEDSDDCDSVSEVIKSCLYQCAGEKLDQRTLHSTDGATIRRLCSVNGTEVSNRRVKRAIEVIVVSDDDTDKSN